MCEKVGVIEVGRRSLRQGSGSLPPGEVKQKQIRHPGGKGIGFAAIGRDCPTAGRLQRKIKPAVPDPVGKQAGGEVIFRTLGGCQIKNLAQRVGVLLHPVAQQIPVEIPPGMAHKGEVVTGGPVAVPLEILKGTFDFFTHASQVAEVGFVAAFPLSGNIGDGQNFSGVQNRRTGPVFDVRAKGNQPEIYRRGPAFRFCGQIKREIAHHKTACFPFRNFHRAGIDQRNFVFAQFKNIQLKAVKANRFRPRYGLGGQ